MTDVDKYLKENIIMKKFLFIFTILFCLFSCHNDGTINTDIDGIISNIEVKEFTYANHSYIEFKDRGLYGHGFEHNPECDCFKDSLNKTKLNEQLIGILENVRYQMETGNAQTRLDVYNCFEKELLHIITGY